MTTYRKVYPNATPFQVQARIRTDSATRKRATTMVEETRQKEAKHIFMLLNGHLLLMKDALAPHMALISDWCWAIQNLIAGIPSKPENGGNSRPSVLAFGKTGDPNCDKIPYWPAYDTESRYNDIRP